MKTIKRLFILVLLASLSFILLGCKETNEESKYVLPTVTNGDTNVAITDNYSVTKNEIYKMIKYSGASSLLLELIDKELFKDITVATTDSEYLSRYNRFVYNTTDTDTIDAYTAEEKSEFLKTFKEGMAFKRYLTDSSIENYIKFFASRDKKAKELITANHGRYDVFPIDDSVLEEYYNENVYNDVHAIVLSFNSVSNFRDFLKKPSLFLPKAEITTI